MYRVYQRKDGTVESLKYRKTYDRFIEVATAGDFRKGYITFSELEFETLCGNCYYDFKTSSAMNAFLDIMRRKRKR